MRENLTLRYQHSGLPVNPDATPAVEYVLSPEPGEPRSRDPWKVLVKRWRLIVLMFLIGFSIGAFMTFRTTPRYTASTILRIEPPNTPVIGVGEVLAGGEEYSASRAEEGSKNSRWVSKKPTERKKGFAGGSASSSIASGATVST